MARNPAMKKAAKAAKRKVIVAAKRKVELAANSLGGRVRDAARQPILECLVSDGLFKSGMGTVTLVRGVSREYQHIAIFMLDTFCLGVKDTHFRTADRQEAEYILDVQHQADANGPIAPEEARKLVRDMVSWADGNCFAPHEDYAALEPLFGDIVPAATDYTAQFGYEGKVLYVPGPSESQADVRRRTRLVESRFGEDAVRSVFDLEDDELDDFDEDFDMEGEIIPDEDESRRIA